MKIISISGLDGSGKSTQIELLSKYLHSKGKKTYYFHAVQFSLAQRLGKKKTASSSEPHKDTGVTKASRLAVALRKLVLPVDLWRFSRLIKSLDKQGYDVLLSDRYFFDTLVNIAYLEKADRLLRLPIRQPDVAFFLNASPDKIMRRKRAPGQGKVYLVSKKRIYEKLAVKYKLIEINGDLAQEAVFNKIKGNLEGFNLIG